MQRKTWTRVVALMAVLALVVAACGESDNSEACDNAQEVTEPPEAAAASWSLYYSVKNNEDSITEGIYPRFPYVCDTWTFNSSMLPIGTPERHEIDYGRAIDAAGAYVIAASPLSEPITTTLGIRLKDGENVDISVQIQIIARAETVDKTSGEALRSLTEGGHTYVVRVPDGWYAQQPQGAGDSVQYVAIVQLNDAGSWVQSRMYDLREESRDELYDQLLAENEEYQTATLEHDALHLTKDEVGWTLEEEQRSGEIHILLDELEHDFSQQATDAVDAMDFLSEDILDDIVFVLAVEIEQIDNVVLVPLED